MPAYSVELRLCFYDYAEKVLDGVYTEPAYVKSTTGEGEGQTTMLWCSLHQEWVLRQWLESTGLHEFFLQENRLYCIDLADVMPSCKEKRRFMIEALAKGAQVSKAARM